MANEPDIPAHLYRALHGHLQDNDRDGAIQVCYELLSSGRSVGEILHEAGPIRGDSEHRDTAAAEQPRSGPERATVPVASELAGIAQANAPGAGGPGVFDESEYRGTEKPLEMQRAPPGEVGSDDREQRSRQNLPGFAPHIIGAAAAQVPRDREAAADFDGRDRFWSRKFPSIVTSVAFWALYTGVVASASIAGFSVLRGGRDTEPAITGVPAHLLRGTEAIATPGTAADHPKAVAETAKPQTQAASADASQMLKPSQPGSPDPAALKPAEPIPVGARGAIAAARQEAEAPRQPDAGQPDAFEQLIDQLADPAAAREPAASVAQSPAAAPIGAAATEPRSDAGQPQTGETPQTAARDETKAAAAEPGETVPAAPPSQAQSAEKPGARAPRRSAGSQQSASRRTAAKRPQPAYAGRSPGANLAAQGAGSHSVDSGRGYGHGAYGPSPYSETGD